MAGTQGGVPPCIEQWMTMKQIGHALHVVVIRAENCFFLQRAPEHVPEYATSSLQDNPASSEYPYAVCGCYAYRGA